MIEVREYDLPDFRISQSDNDFEVCVWQPENNYLVLGQSNHAETSLNTAEVLADKIVVYKRPSGGETVILSPQMLVISVLFKTGQLKNPKDYFFQINEAIIDALKSLGVSDLRQKGISDIAIGEKKILGSSIYRKPDKVFFHAVLNVSENTETIARYIKHPAKEPDYRLGRTHEDFVTSLSSAGHQLDYTELAHRVKSEIKKIRNKLIV